MELKHKQLHDALLLISLYHFGTQQAMTAVAELRERQTADKDQAVADLMDADSVLIIHLVKLINQADTLVCQDQRSTL